MKPLCQVLCSEPARSAIGWPEFIRRGSSGQQRPCPPAPADQRRLHCGVHTLTIISCSQASLVQKVARRRGCETGEGTRTPARVQLQKCAATLGVLEVVPDGGGSGFDASSRAERGIEWHGQGGTWHLLPAAQALAQALHWPCPSSSTPSPIAPRTFTPTTTPDDRRPHHTHITAFAPAPHRLDTHGSTHAGTRCRWTRITRRHARGRRRAVDRGDTRAGGARRQQALREFRELNHKPQHRH